MKTTTLSIAVKREINAINEQNVKIPAKTVKKRLNWELIAAIATLGAIMAGFALLSHFGYIREF